MIADLDAVRQVADGDDVGIRRTGSARQIFGGGHGDFSMRFQLAETGGPQRFEGS